MARSRNYTSTILSAARTADKVAARIARWTVTDHSGMKQAMDYKPKGLGFFASIKYILINFLISMLGAVIAGGLYFLLFAYGIPFLIMGHL